MVDKSSKGIGDWGLGIGDWGLGPLPHPQSPLPNPPPPIPDAQKLVIIMNIKMYYQYNIKFDL